MASMGMLGGRVDGFARIRLPTARCAGSDLIWHLFRWQGLPALLPLSRKQTPKLLVNPKP